MTTPPKYSILEAKTKLEAYCAYQDRCKQEIIDRLKQWGIFGEDQDIIIADLISNQFLNEERFATSYASGKFRIKQWGRSKIRVHLKQKNISEYSINKALSLIDEQEYLDTLERLVVKKWSSIEGQDKWSKINKLKRFLYNKGFETNLFNHVINQHIAT